MAPRPASKGAAPQAARVLQARGEGALVQSPRCEGRSWQRRLSSQQIALRSREIPAWTALCPAALHATPPVGTHGRHPPFPARHSTAAATPPLREPRGERDSGKETAQTSDNRKLPLCVRAQRPGRHPRSEDGAGLQGGTRPVSPPTPALPLTADDFASSRCHGSRNAQLTPFHCDCFHS